MTANIPLSKAVVAWHCIFAAAFFLTACAGTVHKKHPPSTAHVTLDSVGQRVQALSTHAAAVSRRIDNSVNAKVYRQARSLQAEVRALQKQLDLLALRIHANAAARAQLFANLRGRLAAAERHRHYHAGRKSGGDSKQPLPTFDQRKMYLPAFMQLRAGRFDQARLALAKYRKQFPHSYYSADSLYWIAEIDYVQGRLDLAHADFSKLLREHPKDAKAPAALLRLGQIAEQRHQYDRARGLFKQVNKRYPHSTQAGLARQWLKHLSAKKETAADS